MLMQEPGEMEEPEGEEYESPEYEAAWGCRRLV
jgi:hypothetical protein